MSEALNRVTKQYLKFRETKNKIRQRHKRELVELSKEDLAYLGKEIMEARKSGYKINDILATIGLKNRSFLYEALLAWEEVRTPDPDEKPAQPDPGGFKAVVQQIGDNKIEATVGDETRTLTVNSRGVIVDMPEEWLRDLTSQKKEAVRQVITTTQEMFAPVD